MSHHSQGLTDARIRVPHLRLHYSHLLDTGKMLAMYNLSIIYYMYLRNEDSTSHQALGPRKVLASVVDNNGPSACDLL